MPVDLLSKVSIPKGRCGQKKNRKRTFTIFYYLQGSCWLYNKLYNVIGREKPTFVL